MSFIDAFEKRIAADATVIGDSLKTALHNLEVLAAKAVAACIQQHDATPATQAVQETVAALKNAALAAEKDLLAQAGTDAKADIGAAESTAVQVGGVVASDIAAHKTAEILPDAAKVVEASPLAGEVATQAADLAETVAADVAKASDELAK